jgi:hypothetical protein
MKLDYTPHFKRSYFKAQPHIQRAFDKQSALLLKDLRHPCVPAIRVRAQSAARENRTCCVAISLAIFPAPQTTSATPPCHEPT